MTVRGIARVRNDGPVHYLEAITSFLLPFGFNKLSC